MKTVFQLCIMSLLVYMLSSCATGPPTFDAMIRESIPIEIQGSNPVRFVIHTRSPGGVALVGMRCSTEVWKSLTGGTGQVEIQLISSRWKGVKIRREIVENPRDSRKVYYNLFDLLGNTAPFTKVKVQMRFPSAGSEEVIHAEILVFRMPTDSL